MADTHETAAQHLVRIYPSEPISAREAREFVTAEVRHAAARNSVFDNVGLLVSELVTNAIQHGDGSAIVVSIDHRSDTHFLVTVTSGVAANRPPLDPANWMAAPLDQPSGRGLDIVRQLADDTEVTLVADRLGITCRLRR